MFKQENTFEAIADSSGSSRVHLLTSIFFQAFLAWAIGAKILLIYHPFLWQETLFLYLSVHRNSGIILFQGNTSADDFQTGLWHALQVYL